MSKLHLTVMLAATVCIYATDRSTALAATVNDGALATFSTPGELDLAGDFVYAASMGDAAAGTNADGVRVVGGLDFSNSTVAGLTMTGSNFTGASSIADPELNILVETTQFGPNSANPQIDLAVDPGIYKVQLLIWEPFFSATNSRIFDIEVEGTTVVEDLDPFAEHGAGGTSAVVYTLTLGVTDGTLDINLPASANLGIISGLTVERIPTIPEPSTMVLAAFGLMGLLVRRRRQR